jgi:hypothetical protein
MKKIVLLILMFLILSGCQSSPNSTSIPTAKTVALADIDLHSISFLPGDLPDDFTAGQFKYTNLPEMYNNFGGYVNQINQEFKINGRAAGSTTILLFSSPKYLDSAFSIFTDNLGESGSPVQGITVTVDKISDLGDRSIYSIMSGLDKNTSDLIFTRCQGLVQIILLDEGDLETTTNYARKICP